MSLEDFYCHIYDNATLDSSWEWIYPIRLWEFKLMSALSSFFRQQKSVGGHWKADSVYRSLLGKPAFLEKTDYE